MIYQRMKQAIFCSRPNRFIANIKIDGQEQVCHVKNTGRCKELLLPGVPVMVQEADNPDRKTKYDLISVWKGNRIINIDSSAPNKVFGEWAAKSGYFAPDIFLKPECKHGDSRFDFYMEYAGQTAFAEIKGATLEQDGIVRFPDAPTLRGVKHVNGLIQCVEQGYLAYIVFIIQMNGVRFFEPNWETHPEFGQALQRAQQAGVKILALDCCVTENEITAGDFVEVHL